MPTLKTTLYLPWRVGFDGLADNLQSPMVRAFGGAVQHLCKYTNQTLRFIFICHSTITMLDKGPHIYEDSGCATSEHKLRSPRLCNWEVQQPAKLRASHTLVRFFLNLKPLLLFLGGALSILPPAQIKEKPLALCL